MTSQRFEKVLVANRGEIARRVLRSLREMGLSGVAVYSDADARAPHVREADEAVRLGPAPAAESYLSIERILAAARETGADAVHPGYGFLAENPELAAACAREGIAFVGPPAEVMRKAGSKIEAKQVLAAAGVPVIPGGSGERQRDADLAAEAREIGFPIVVKASAGGGGKGMRIVRAETELGEALAAARREAAAAFGDETLLLERQLEAARHVEVQILGDAHGQMLHCFERDCSVQRRHQKLIEETPSPAVDDRLRRRLGEAAVAAGKALGYVGAGTVEFLLEPSGEFYFLEINARLQVEHPVTEAVTGLDLVRLQILVAQGLPLPLGQDDLSLDGHAIEARLYAEDPANGFLPATGRIALWEPEALPGLRYDAGIEAGSEVGVHYDPLLAKLVASAPTRGEAIARLVRALRALAVGGVTTNRDFLVRVLTHPEFAAGTFDTGFVERRLPPEALRPEVDPSADRWHALAAALHAHERRRRAPGPLPPSLPSGWRNNRWRPQDVSYRIGEREIEVLYVARPNGAFDVEVAGAASRVERTQADEAGVAFELDGVRRRFRVATDGERSFVHGPLGGAELAELPRFPRRAGEEVAGGCVAPMTGVVRQVRVAAGDRVEAGALLLVLEAMKMEHPLVARTAGVVVEVRVEVGQMVDPDQVLIVVEGDA